MRLAAMALTLAALTLAACGDDDDDGATGPDGAALASAFGERATAAYEEEGKDRDEDFAQGLLTGDCFVADEETISGIGEELGLSEATLDEESAFLVGPPGEEERISCAIKSEDVTGGGMGAGTTLAEPDQLRERLLRQDGAEEIEGEPGELNPEQVIATQSEGASQYVWTDGAFTVGVFGPSAEIEPDEGFAALEAAVTGVERTLTSEEEGG